MEELDHKQLVPTARIPLLGGTRLLWVKSLTQNKSYYTMSMLVSKLADQAGDLPEYLLCDFAYQGKKGQRDQEDQDETGVDVKVDKAVICMDDVGVGRVYATRTEKYLRWGMAKDFNNFVLFFTIPRHMLESIVLGTVAWDYDKARGRPRDEYNEHNGMGIYVIGLSVAGREGAWLTATEIRSLIEDMEKYLRGYEVWTKSKDKSKWDDGDLQKFVAEVDNQFGTHNETDPRFVTSARSRDGMGDLIAGLERRVESSLRLNPAGDTPLIQTPLYVGLASELYDSIEAHRMDIGVNSTLKASDQAYAFILSLMKHRGGVPPALTCRCVLRVWRKKALWFAETLVASLANSLICHDGLNRTECGDPVQSKKPSYDKDGEDYVKVWNPFLHRNLDAALTGLRERAAMLDDAAALRAIMAEDGLPMTVSKLEENVGLLEQTMYELRCAREELSKRMRAQEANIAKLEKEKAFLELFDF